MNKQQFKVGDIITEKDYIKDKNNVLSVIVSISGVSVHPTRQFKIMNMKTGKKFVLPQAFVERYLRVVA
tara:strand:+ start:1571 stop:1777 length:207 start_codon:yes stop_codon:yes gene_type:complete